MAMISTVRTKIKAEAGHPCLIPRKTLKGAETHQLFRLDPSISVYIVWVHLINELLKPKEEEVNFQWDDDNEVLFVLDWDA